jgi:hypothetical protein
MENKKVTIFFLIEKICVYIDVCSKLSKAQ